MVITFEELMQRRCPNPPSTLLSLDPGETTGWACFTNGRYASSGQLDTVTNPMRELRTLFNNIQPDAVVMEDYVVYAHKVQQHTNNKLITPRVIGMLEGICEEASLPLTKQLAAQAKGFVTDQKLRQWQLWQVGERHARDAIRHAVYYLIFKGNNER